MDLHRNYINSLIDNINMKRSILLELNRENRCCNIRKLDEYPQIRHEIENSFNIIKSIIYIFFGKKYFLNFIQRNGIELYIKNPYKDKLKNTEQIKKDLIETIEIKNILHFIYNI